MPSFEPFALNRLNIVYSQGEWSAWNLTEKQDARDSCFDMFLDILALVEDVLANPLKRFQIPQFFEQKLGVVVA
jgi:hypothetical protein